MFKIPRKFLINFILALCVFLSVSHSLSCFKNQTQKAFKPHLSLIGLLKREAAGIIFYHRNMIRADKLKNETGYLRLKLFELREINQENIRLKKLLGFKQKSLLRFIPARVIGRSADSWSSVLIIDKGSYNGAKPGMIVINSEGLVGRIAESADNSSKVLLINDPSIGISSIVQRSRQEGLVSGSLGANLIMRYLPQDAQIAVGDTIVTSELSQIYPKGILIGRVVNIGRDFSGLSRYAVIKPAANLSSIEEVLVIIP